MLSLLRVLGRVPTGSAFAALPLAAALTAATQQWCWVVWACGVLLGLTVAWMFAPWIPYVRDLVPAHRRFQRLEALWVEGHSIRHQDVQAEADFLAWEAKRADWETRADVWIRSRISAIEAARFLHVGISGGMWLGSFSDAHSAGISKINAQLGELIRLRDAEAERLR